MNPKDLKNKYPIGTTVFLKKSATSHCIFYHEEPMIVVGYVLKKFNSILKINPPLKNTSSDGTLLHPDNIENDMKQIRNLNLLNLLK